MATILDKYPLYEATIGIEIHVQLLTASKIFCSCANQVGQESNTNICMICAGYPGSLPVFNKQVLEYAITLGLATNSDIAPLSTFARKHYFYPDLPKNYQITQSDNPICSNGYVSIRLEDGSIKKIHLIRIHMEEDAGKNIHVDQSNESFVDLNRTGTPLLEIVTQPDIANAYEARAYLQELHRLVRHLNICSGNMEDGAFRGDTNISVKKKTDKQLGTKVELKNINSFKFIADAIDYEIERQIELIEQGGKVRQETRLWDTKNKKTVVMRSKEEAADYRYFLDPDLPYVEVTQEWIERIRSTLPELPTQKIDRFIQAYGLTREQADILIDDQELTAYFERAYKRHPSKQIINWVVRDVVAHLKEHKISILEYKVTAEKLAEIVQFIETGSINNHAAKEIVATIAVSGDEVKQVIQEKGLEQVGSSEEIEAIIKDIISSNQEQVTEYKSGKDKLFGFFVGLAMQKTKGKGNPKIIQELLKKHLNQ